MFVAGIELFFGVATGAILLVIGLRILFWMVPKARFIAVYLLVFVREFFRAFGRRLIGQNERA